MPSGAPSTQKIIDAWLSVSDEWIVRRNKGHTDCLQWEVMRRWGDLSVIDDATQGEYALCIDGESRHSAPDRAASARGEVRHG